MEQLHIIARIDVYWLLRTYSALSVLRAIMFVHKLAQCKPMQQLSTLYLCAFLESTAWRIHYTALIPEFLHNIK